MTQYLFPANGPRIRKDGWPSSIYVLEEHDLTHGHWFTVDDIPWGQLVGIDPGETPYSHLPVKTTACVVGWACASFGLPLPYSGEYRNYAPQRLQAFATFLLALLPAWGASSGQHHLETAEDLLALAQDVSNAYERGRYTPKNKAHWVSRWRHALTQCGYDI